MAGANHSCRRPHGNRRAHSPKNSAPVGATIGRPFFHAKGQQTEKREPFGGTRATYGRTYGVHTPYQSAESPHVQKSRQAGINKKSTPRWIPPRGVLVLIDLGSFLLVWFILFLFVFVSDYLLKRSLSFLRKPVRFASFFSPPSSANFFSRSFCSCVSWRGTSTLTVKTRLPRLPL